MKDWEINYDFDFVGEMWLCENCLKNLMMPGDDVWWNERRCQAACSESCAKQLDRKEQHHAILRR